MKNILSLLEKYFFSMSFMALGLLIFIIGIGTATFLESFHGRQAAEILVYNALWFELLLLYLSMSLIANIFKYKMWMLKKIPVLTFHVAFLVIILGAAITRYSGFNGTMIIEEGSESSTAYSSDPLLLIQAWDKKTRKSNQITKKQLLSDITKNSNRFHYEFNHNGKLVEVDYVNFMGNRHLVIEEGPNIKGEAVELVFGRGDTVLLFKSDLISNSNIQYENFPDFETTINVIDNFGKDKIWTNPSGEKSIKSYKIGFDFMSINENNMESKLPISYNRSLTIPSFEIKKQGDTLVFRSPFETTVSDMSRARIEDREKNILDPSIQSKKAPNTWHLFSSKSLYRIGDFPPFAFRGIRQNTKLSLRKRRADEGEDFKSGLDYLTLDLKYNGTSQRIVLKGGKDRFPVTEQINLGGSMFILEYGAIRKEIPYTLALKDFKVEKYPGSQVASGYSSEVTVKKPNSNDKIDYRIYMNHTLDIDEYRFFQSGFSKDEKNTNLSVNQDGWGWSLTLVGYILLALGMILSIFSRSGRFSVLSKKINGLKEKRTQILKNNLLLILTFASFSTFAQHKHPKTTNDDLNRYHQVISKEHAEKVERLLIQEIKYDLDFNPTGRYIPFNTLANRLLYKIYRNKSYKDYNSVQTVLSMHLYSNYWKKEPIIYVHKVLRERLNLEKYVPYSEVCKKSKRFNNYDSLIWENQYNAAIEKGAGSRNEFDKELIKFMEKFQIIQGVFNWDFLRIAPLFEDKKNTWVSPKWMFNSFKTSKQIDSIFVNEKIDSIYRSTNLEIGIEVETKPGFSTSEVLEITKNILDTNENYYTDLYLRGLIKDTNVNKIIEKAQLRIDNFISSYTFDRDPERKFYALDHIFRSIEIVRSKGNYSRSDTLLNQYIAFIFKDIGKENAYTCKQQMRYLMIELDKACRTGDYTIVDKHIEEIIDRQRKLASDVVPSKLNVSLEIFHNKWDIFKRVSYVYILVGFLSLIVFFSQIFTNTKFKQFFKWFHRISLGLFIVSFIFHTFGLGLRWYLSDHAPWMSHYEASSFIAWCAILAGFAFYQKSRVVLPATALVAYFMLWVSHLELMDPDISLVSPVLNSVYLKIHVATVVSSYAFLGLGAILGLINLIIIITRNFGNRSLIDTYLEEITYISEMTITIGLFLLTIGTFLGGVWGNESWGRYWAWDPKETWALICILLYAIQLHLRFIPALNNRLVFNLFSLWAYSAMLFNYFGVNFWLVGLHSYAKGEVQGWPSWIYYVLIVLYFLSELAAALYVVGRKNYTFNFQKMVYNFFIKLGVFILAYTLTYGIYLYLVDSVDYSTFLDLIGKFILIVSATFVLLIPIRMGLLNRK